MVAAAGNDAADDVDQPTRSEADRRHITLKTEIGYAAGVPGKAERARTAVSAAVEECPTARLIVDLQDRAGLDRHAAAAQRLARIAFDHRRAGLDRGQAGIIVAAVGQDERAAGAVAVAVGAAEHQRLRRRAALADQPRQRGGDAGAEGLQDRRIARRVGRHQDDIVRIGAGGAILNRRIDGIDRTAAERAGGGRADDRAVDGDVAGEAGGAVEDQQAVVIAAVAGEDVRAEARRIAGQRPGAAVALVQRRDVGAAAKVEAARCLGGRAVSAQGERVGAATHVDRADVGRRVEARILQHESGGAVDDAGKVCARTGVERNDVVAATQPDRASGRSGIEIGDEHAVAPAVDRARLPVRRAVVVERHRSAGVELQRRAISTVGTAAQRASIGDRARRRTGDRDRRVIGGGDRRSLTVDQC